MMARETRQERQARKQFERQQAAERQALAKEIARQQRKEKEKQQALGCLGLIVIVVAIAVFASSIEQQAEADRVSVATERVSMSPDELVWSIADEIVRGDVVSAEAYAINSAVLLTYMMEDFTYNVGFTEREMLRLTCTFRDRPEFAGWRHQFVAQITVSNQFGETSVVDGLVVRLLPDSISRINCTDEAITGGMVRLPEIADYYEVHPAIGE